MLQARLDDAITTSPNGQSGRVDAAFAALESRDQSAQVGNSRSALMTDDGLDSLAEKLATDDLGTELSDNVLGTVLDELFGSAD